MIPVLIPAAGASSRMRGTDKLLMQVDGQPLLRRQVQMALSVSGDIRVALPPRLHARYDVVSDLNAQLVEVPDAADGLGASLRTLFGTLDNTEPHAIVLLADLPDISGDELRALISAARAHPDALIWRGATADGAGGHPLMLARPIFHEFKDLQGDEGGQTVLKRHAGDTHLVRFADNRARNDLDTPEDWAAWAAARPKRAT